MGRKESSQTKTKTKIKLDGERFNYMHAAVFLHAFLSADFFSQKFNLFKKIFQKNMRVSNSSDPDQVQCFVWPDLCPNCLQRLYAGRVKQNVRPAIFKHFGTGIHLLPYVKENRYS